LGSNLVVSDAARDLETTQEPPKRSNWLGRTASAADQPIDRSNAITIRFVTPKFLRPLIKFASFIGPGFMIAVAYIDPGNYSTDVSAGAQSRYALLFVVLMANLFAVFLQSLCIKLGTVTGRNLAEMCRLHLPRWLNIILYLFIETAIIATDMAEVCQLPFSTTYLHQWTYVDSGDRNRHRAKSAFEHPSRCRMCSHYGRCSFAFIVLSTRWVYDGTPSFRVIRHGAGIRCDNLFLYSTISD
jgi:hypothetical protein